MEIIEILEKLAKKKRKRIRILSEKEYNARNAKVSSMELYGTETEKRSARIMRNMPYELYKKICDEINFNRGYR